MNLPLLSFARGLHKPTLRYAAWVLTFVVGSLATCAAAKAQQTNPDFAPITAAIYGSSTPTPTFSSDGQRVSYPLVRQDLTLSLGGITQAPESVASGYIGISEPSSGVFFIDGAIPALNSELPTLEQALSTAGLPITAMDTQVPGLSQEVVTVHFAATVSGSAASSLPGSLAAILATVGNPQNSVIVYILAPGTNLGFDAPFDTLRSQGVTTLIDGNAFVVSVPRPDESTLTLSGSSVRASESLGVSNKVYMSGSGTAFIEAELALLPSEVASVSQVLTNAGFTITSQANYFTNDSGHLVFLHAIVQTSDASVMNSDLDAVASAIALLP